MAVWSWTEASRATGPHRRVWAQRLQATELISACLEVHPGKADPPQCKNGDLMALPYTMGAFSPDRGCPPSTGQMGGYSPTMPEAHSGLQYHTLFPLRSLCLGGGMGPDRSSTEGEEAGHMA